jgi:hypothetical protein
MAKRPVADEAVQTALVDSLRAPSAHNAQPWRLTPEGSGTYRLWYAFADKLLADPDDRDGIMAMGGFYETLSLAAERVGLQTRFDHAPSTHSHGIDVGVISFSRLKQLPSELASSVAKRQCNRYPYSPLPIPPGLQRALEDLGNLMLPPASIAGLVAKASVMAWKDHRFIEDLAQWTRFDDVSPDGMTVDCLRLTATDQVALKFALRLGRLPGGIARLYAERDVRLTRASGAMAVLTAEDREPSTLFECGRRLIRSWTLINHLGYSWHPMSIVIDQPTVAELAEMIDGRDAVAIYRVGYTPASAAWSKRRDLSAVLVSQPG